MKFAIISLSIKIFNTKIININSVGTIALLSLSALGGYYIFTKIKLNNNNAEYTNNLIIKNNNKSTINFYNTYNYYKNHNKNI